MTLRTDIVAGDTGHAALHNAVNEAANEAVLSLDTVVRGVVDTAPPVALPAGYVWIRPNSPTSPLTIASWRAAHWASLLTGEDLSAVSSWPAAVGGSNYDLTHYEYDTGQFTPAPTLARAAPKMLARPAVLFTAGASDKGNTMIGSTVGGSSMPETVVLVGYADAASVFTDSIGQGRRFTLGGSTYSMRAAGGTSVTITGATPDFLPHLWIMEFVQNALTLEIDGTLYATATTSSSSSNTGVVMGGHTSSSTSACLTGGIAFRAEKDGLLSGGEKSALRAWAADYYGLTMAA